MVYIIDWPTVLIVYIIISVNLSHVFHTKQIDASEFQI